MGEQVVVGRDSELKAVYGFLTDVSHGPQIQIVEGVAGSGKTTLWNAGVAEADRRGFRVLSARPSDSETGMSFAALDDLFYDVVDEVLPSLPEPQRRALEVVMLRASPVDVGVDGRTVARAVFETLRVLVRSSDVLVAVDDVQWLDSPSARILEFSLRRLSDEPIGVLFAWRGLAGASAPLGLDRAPSGAEVRRLPVGPLTIDAMHDVIALHLGVSLPRSTMGRVHDASGGNPFYGLEIVRALVRDGRPDLSGVPLPIPPSLTALVRRRITRLPVATRSLLPFVAALSQPTIGLAETASRSSDASDRLSKALRAGVLVANADRLEFSHPLVGAAVYGQLSPARRRTVHRRLAEVVTDSEERARHLGLGTAEPNADVASTLDVAAGVALSRGAPSAAAELYEQACRLTPQSDV